MKIDIWAHTFPAGFREILTRRLGKKFAQFEGTPTLWDLDKRFRIMDQFPGLYQVLVPAGPCLEQIARPEEAAELARIANDEMHKIVSDHPDRFLAAVALVPLNNIDACLKEIERAVKELRFRGIFMYTPVYSTDARYPMAGGKPLDSPELMPVYELMARLNLPIWLHPLRENIVPDYASETKSKYYSWQVFGWPYESTLAMTRLVFSGILEQYPNLKFITHHCGAMIPFFSKRITAMYDYGEMRLGRKHKDGLSRDPIDYFRMFYADTAVNGNTASLMCGYEFFGAGHILFGTDMPYDAQIGMSTTQETIESIERMALPEEDRKRIFSGNARELLRLPL